MKPDEELIQTQIQVNTELRKKLFEHRSALLFVLTALYRCLSRQWEPDFAWRKSIEVLETSGIHTQINDEENFITYVQEG